MAKQPAQTAPEEPAQTEHTLLLPIAYHGEDKNAGDTVLLWPDQAERLREQGAIK